jgi:hypothetical protein
MQNIARSPKQQDATEPWQKSPQAAAVYYASLGLNVFPCSAAKIPLIRKWQLKATTALSIVDAWWRIWPFAETACSLPASIAVLDIDIKRGRNGFRDFERLVGIPADQFVTPSASSPSGGLHLFCATGGKRYLNAIPIPGTEIDLKTRGGFVVLPGAGNGRFWLPDKPNKPAPIPAAIATLLKERPDEASRPNGRENPPLAPLATPLTAFTGNPTRYGRAALERICADIRNASDSQQQAALSRGGLKVRRLINERELPLSAMEQVRAAALDMPSYDPRDPWTPRQIDKEINRALRREIPT